MFHIQDSLNRTQLRAIALRLKRSILLLGVAIVSGALMLLVPNNPTSAQGKVSKFVGDGDFASAVLPTTNGLIIVRVSRGGPPQDPQTILFYAVMQFFPPVFISQSGEGVIPNDDLKVMGQKVILNTDTSAIPDFTNTLCTPNENTCGPGTGGVISVEWNKSGDFSSRSTGNSEFSFGNIVMRSVGTTHETSATAQGTALGTPFQTEFAFIGTQHQVNLTFERGN
ncbi:MAG: hypothetical protein MOB07_21105 [Acidobacteria bacterium]|nr:hypothetical protein [Acidobacteriota bacterium]